MYMSYIDSIIELAAFSTSAVQFVHCPVHHSLEQFRKWINNNSISESIDINYVPL